MSSTVAPFRPCKTQPVSLLLLMVLSEPRLAGFSVLFVVETMLATAWHRMWVGETDFRFGKPPVTQPA